ncbi:MYB-like transcription factor ETC3 [Vicia villosa]|uniref:MYB-like transcription factor ETC3 n=1 Tax=Vicia villosa TaxID=3911 RepID=UPI00273C0322|nr:MYB-like transcription factor ETC3 [Vicia villosa]
MSIEERPQNKAKIYPTTSATSQEVSSTEWGFIEMSEQEVDLICRMHDLVGDRWNLIAGRIPGRKAEEIERFWIMRHADHANRNHQHIEK